MHYKGNCNRYSITKTESKPPKKSKEQTRGDPSGFSTESTEEADGQKEDENGHVERDDDQTGIEAAQLVARLQTGDGRVHESDRHRRLLTYNNRRQR